MTTTFRYGPFGRLVTVTDPAGVTEERTYDERDNVRMVTSTDAGTVTHHFDAFGNLAYEAQPDGEWVFNIHDDLGRLTFIKDAEGYTQFTFDAPVDRSWRRLITPTPRR